MIRYVLVRHGQAESSSPLARLTEIGRSQVSALAMRLKGWELDAAWSSDFARAVETAGLLWDGREPFGWHQTPALREIEVPKGLSLPAADPIRYADWERECLADLELRLGEWLSQAPGTGADTQVRPYPRREAAHTASEGTVPTIDFRVSGIRTDSEVRPYEDCSSNDRADARSVLVVSHAGPLRVLICLLLGLPVQSHWAFRLDCAGLTVIDRCEDMGTLLLLNDRCHLGGHVALPGKADRDPVTEGEKGGR